MKPPVEAPTSRQSRPLGIDAELGQRRLELEAAARDVAAAALDLDPDVVGHHLPGLQRLLAAAADPDLAGADRGRGGGPRRQQAALGDQRVEPRPAHRGPDGSEPERIADGTLVRTDNSV